MIARLFGHPTRARRSGNTHVKAGAAGRRRRHGERGQDRLVSSHGPQAEGSHHHGVLTRMRFEGLRERVLSG